ncbi:MAG TPA: hypothetical protein EYP20_01805 [Aigarchaeota archaeon]|nr:hypothetical protein [Aigarchaeota archaeon]
MVYLVKEGDRWDTIAHRFYGNPYLYEPIIRENPQYLGLPYPPPGALLKIPYVIVETEEEVRPPWALD